MKKLQLTTGVSFEHSNKWSVFGRMSAGRSWAKVLLNACTVKLNYDWFRSEENHRILDQQLLDQIPPIIYNTEHRVLVNKAVPNIRVNFVYDSKPSFLRKLMFWK